jgi:heterodisulfide reductase subunit C
MKTETPYEAARDVEFLDRIASLPEGERMLSCIQCGTCSGSCPTAFAMEETPRRIFAMVRAGMRDEVLSSMTPWICASCYRCTVQCPQEIRITDIMYALKREAIARGVSPRDKSLPSFARLFTGIVKKFGRGYELGLMMAHFLVHNPLEMMKQAPLGMSMMLEGRMPLLPHRIKDAKGFRKMVAKAEEIDRGVEA